MFTSLDYRAYIFEAEKGKLIEENKDSPPFWKNCYRNAFLWENHYEKGEMVSGFVGFFL